MYKVRTQELEAIKKHLNNVEHQLWHTEPYTKQIEKLLKDNDKLIKLIKHNFNV